MLQSEPLIETHTPAAPAAAAAAAAYLHTACHALPCIAMRSQGNTRVQYACCCCIALLVNDECLKAAKCCMYYTGPHLLTLMMKKVGHYEAMPVELQQSHPAVEKCE